MAVPVCQRGSLAALRPVTSATVQKLKVIEDAEDWNDGGNLLED